MPYWVGRVLGRIPDGGHFIGALWHWHEMVFGYTLAVLSGFLAIRVRGPRLLALIALWTLGRIAVTAGGGLPPSAVAAVDLAYIPALILLRVPTLWSVLKWPNISFLPLLLALGAVNTALHLGALRPPSPESDARAVMVAIDMLALLITVMAGRLVPGYTGATLTHIRPPRRAEIEAASVVLLVGVAALDALGRAPALAGAAAFAVALLQSVRFMSWRPWEAAPLPLLWILHIGYAWLIIALAMRGLGAFGAFAPTLPVHALTVGAVGSLTLGMMSRIALSHAGRPLTAGRGGVAAFALIEAAAVARVFGPLLLPQAATDAVVAAGVLWTCAFVVWLAAYGSLLVAGRRAGRSAEATG